MDKTVTLSIKGSLLAVIPVNPETEQIVVSCATYQKKVSNGSSRMSYEDCYLCSTEPGYILTFSGLHARIKKAFERRGYTVRTNIALQKVLTPDINQLVDSDLLNFEGRDDQMHVLGMIADHPGGFIVDAPTGWGKSYVIAQVCQMFPGHSIAVVSPGKEVTSMLYRRIKAKVRDVGQVGAGERRIERITVCTAESLSKLRHNDWDLLLFDEVHRAGAPGTANAISEVFKTAKCVGFSASPTGRSDGADLLVEALFGPVSYKVDYSVAADRGDIVPIRVLAHHIDRGSAIETERSVVKNRAGLWTNDIRNSYIAKVANSIDKDEQVLIMAATTQHVLELRRYLPDFEVIFSDVRDKLLANVYSGHYARVEGLDSTGKLTEARRMYMRKEFEAGRMKKVIATNIWSTGVDFKQLQWLIRADGMSSTIMSVQTPGRLSRTFDGKEYGNLIDFIDNFDPSLQARSMKRMRQYKKNGWVIKEVRDPAVCVGSSFSDARGPNARRG